MLVKSLKIKNESIFYSNDMIQLNNFDSRLLKINKRENREIIIFIIFLIK